ncbi:MAG: glycoside-pentoside-hexuronide (GPH):cation symporter [Myxococcota bacterium]|nr:glycoside-pentoside-hexuronide (GPH):cation symporter [Myxococcota bacterium]
MHDGPGGLPVWRKSGYALGDAAVNVQLAATSLFYLFFLTEVAGLRPSLAGLVLLVGRAFDAFSDPAMGRISDRTRWRLGRRRPFFLIGALPFGLTFAGLWSEVSLGGDLAPFLVYAALYVANTLSSTILAVPYMALLPEMAISYEERTSANAWRMLGVVLAILGTAVCMRPLVEAFGGGPAGWARAGGVLGVVVAVPWLVVHRVSFERPGFQRPATSGLRDGLRGLLAHVAYRRLCAFFLTARIAVDVVGAMLIFWFTYWLRREDDFSLGLGLMLGTVAVSLPVWLWLGRRFDKRALFLAGAGWWIAVQVVLFTLGPEDPRWLVLFAVALAGIGYGVCDLMPWSMLGDVVDEAELERGERLEGLYAGVFTFLRKLGGATGVAVAGIVLDLAGFVQGSQQSETALAAIRVLALGVPIAFLSVSLWLAARYPLTRRRHEEIRAALALRGS